MMDLPPPTTYPGLPPGSQVDIWMAEFSHLTEIVVGGISRPGHVENLPSFHAVYVVVNAGNGQALVAFAPAHLV